MISSANSQASKFAFPKPDASWKRFGFKFAPGGPHISRTMMLREFESLLSAVPWDAPTDAYADAIIARNVLGKATESTRVKTLRHLRELYGLSSELPIFRALRHFHASDAAALPQLALLCAWTRDPLLRATTLPVMFASVGEIVSSSALAEAVSEAFPMQYSILNQQKVARNARATWTYSGHLHGHTQKIRAKIVARPAAVAYAFFLAAACGVAGAALLASAWCRLLDLTAEQAQSSGAIAHRYGLLTFRAAGSVIDVSFPQVLLN